MLKKVKQVWGHVKDSGIVETLTSKKAVAVVRIVVASYAVYRAVKLFRDARKDET